MNKNQITLFIIVGRLGENLVVSKAKPIADHPEVKKVYIFKRKEGRPIENCEYITIPGWMEQIKPRLLGKLIRQIFEPFQLLYYAIKIKPDFINGVYTLPKGLNAFLVSRIVGTKSIISVIGGKEEVYTKYRPKKLWWKVNRWQLKNCDYIFTKGPKDKEFLIQEGYDASKIFPFNGSVDLNLFQFQLDPKDIDVLFIGYFYELKGPDRVIQTIYKLVEKHPGIKSVFLGEGEMFQEMKQLVKELNLENNIEMAGYISQTRPYYNRAKTLMLPSRSEGLPNVMLEAMASGCVPVMSNVGNISEVIIHNFNGMLVDDYRDIDSFAECIDDLLQNEETRINKAYEGRKTVEERFSHEAQTESFNAFVQKIKLN